LSTRQPFEDAATESRCITFTTQEVEVSLDIPLQVQDQFHNRAQELRNELLQWRFDNLHRIKVDEKAIREKFGNRLAQIGSALLAVVEDEGARQRIIEYLTLTGVQEKQNRAAAMVLEGLTRIEEAVLADEDEEDDGGDDKCHLRKDRIVLLKHVTCFANSAARDFGGLTEKQPGSGVYISISEIKGILRSLDFSVKRAKQGNVVHIDTAHLAKMREKYGLDKSVEE
jgi:hypothetical protein